MSYEVVDHTADTAIRITSSRIEGILTEAARGLIETTGASTTGTTERLEVRVDGIDIEDILVRWLQEIIYLTGTKNFRISDISITKLDENSLECTLTGCTESTPLDTEIKAATYHGLCIEKTEEGLQATVVFDT